ncbi:hypothetical protein MKX03_003056 [Papaver bracteatum]|nr:hypothetical protein MKX03_003056 [Papaver bracteatum]
MNYDFASPCSSPPTPSSPLPVSVDLGQEKYNFSPSSSDSAPPSPPFSPISNKHCSSPKVSPLFQQSRQFNAYRHSTMTLGWDNLRQPSAFSLDQEPHEENTVYKESSCLKNLIKWLFLGCCNWCRIKWLFLKCCNWCSRLTTLPSKPKEPDHPFQDGLHWKL